MKFFLKSSVAASVITAVLLTAGCGGVGGSEGGGDEGDTNSAEEIYRTGYELGARDALAGQTSDYGRHLNSFDSPFVVQFESGYQKGYRSY